MQREVMSTSNVIQILFSRLELLLESAGLPRLADKERQLSDKRTYRIEWSRSQHKTKVSLNNANQKLNPSKRTQN